MQTQVNAPPIEWPKVTIGGRPYLMKYTPASLLLLMDWGIATKDINEWRASEHREGRGISADLKLGLATVGNFDSSGEWQPLDAKPAVTAAKFLENEWAAIANNWVKAMQKVAPPAEAPKLEAQQTTEPDPVQ